MSFRVLDDLDLTALADLPDDFVNAIVSARTELGNIETERANVAIERETERASTNSRIRSLEEALGALATRSDETLAPVDELPPSAALGTYADLVGTYLSSDRSDLELEHSIMQIVSKNECSRLSASDKAKLHAVFVKGSPAKFKGTSTIVGLEEISTIETVSSFSQLRLELQKHITSISAHPVFLVLKFNSEGGLIDPDTPEGAPTNLLSVSILPPVSEVEQTMRFYHRQGSAFNRENLVWTFNAVRNSCDKDLQAILDAKMLKYAPTERFGPLYYYELVHQMTDVDSKSIRGITQELTSLKVTDQEGQSIAKTCSIIRSTFIWLEMVSMVPPDIDAIVLDILETCTVPDFQLFLKTLSTNAALNNIKLTHVDLLDKAENYYRTLVITKKWDAIGHQGSTFQAQRTSVGATNAQNPQPRVAMPPWSRTAPTAGEPHEKTFEATLFKWCSICQRWFFGHRAHLTAEHQAGHPSRGRRPAASASPAAPVAPAVHLASSPADSPNAEPSVPASSPPLSRTYFTGGL